MTVDEVSKRLVAEREAVESRLTALRGDFRAVVAASESSNADDEHDPEGSTIAYERSQLRALIAQAEHRLTEIGRALEAVAAGAYGTCRRCGLAIPAEALGAEPVARAMSPVSVRRSSEA